MKRYARRMFVAFIVSFTSFLGTVIWYKSGIENYGDDANKKPIARLEQVINEVQRKPLARVIWEQVSKDQQLYAGEAIRTSEDSGARIVFEETGTIIELEPESLVVLELNSLDFKQGNLLVKNVGGGSGKGLMLKSGENQIDLQNAEMSLAKSDQGSLNLEMIKGTAAIQSGDKTFTLDKDKSGVLTDQGMDIAKDRIKVITPLPGNSLYINPEKKESIVFNWEKLPAGYTVYLERGTSRTQLTRNEDLAIAGESGEIKAHFKIGKYYWRLVGMPKDDKLPPLSSNVFSIDVQAKTPPQPLEPTKDAQVVVKKDDPQLRIKWAARANFENIAVEIARDPNLKQELKQQYLDTKLSFADIEMKNSGIYYWRLTGYIKIGDKLEAVSSEVQTFNLKVGIDLVPPQLKSPMDKQRLTYNQVLDKGLTLSWDSVPGISEYKLLIQSVGKDPTKKDIVTEKIVVTNPVRLSDFKPGNYEWNMASVGQEGKLSTFSDKRKFTIEEMPRIDWADAKDFNEYFYVTSQPSLTTSWTSTNNVTAWRYRIAPQGELNDTMEWRTTDKPTLTSTVPKDGRYEVELEGLDDNKRVVAKAFTKIVHVKQLPLLPAPQFALDLPTLLKSDRKGKLDLSWNEVNGANQYKVIIRSVDGTAVVQERSVERTLASISKLKPGKYKVTLSAIDKHARTGAESETRELEVPELSDIQAPKIKKLNVK